MVEQMEMKFRAVRQKLGRELAGELITILRDEHKNNAADWVTRKMLQNHGFNDRMCRLARQYAKGLVLFGQRGYRLTECATLAEITQAASTLESQSRVMMEEARDLWRIMHGRGEFKRMEA